MKCGKLITIEGTEGAGKSTVLQFIQDYLRPLGLDIVLTREPGGTPFAEALRSLLLHADDMEPLTKEAELLLMFAGRAQHISHCILPALHSGKWVVSDRYVDATYAYQGGGRGIDVQQIKLLDRLIVGDLYPDLTLLLDVSPEVGFDRTRVRGAGKDRIEQEKIDFFIRVREAYLARASQDPRRIKMIDASLTLPEVSAQIKVVLDEFIAQQLGT